MSDLSYMLNAHPISIATKEYQRRKHRKRRINKKWRKIYGCVEVDMMPYGQVLATDNGTLIMTKRTYQDFRKAILGVDA